MNKTEFIAELSALTNCTIEEATVVNEILEAHFILSKKAKAPVIADISARLGFDEARAEAIYEQSMAIIKSEKKDKMKHPFRSQD